MIFEGLLSIFIVVSALKLYINGKFLTQQSTGVQAYAIGILEAMKRQNIAFEVLVPKSVPLSDRFNMKHIGSFSNANIWEQCYLPRHINKQPHSILINLCNSAPLLAKNQIVTIHDLAFEQKGVNWFSNKFKKWYRFLIPKIAKSARVIFTVSEFSKQEIISHYKINKEKIRVIPNGLNTHIHVAPRQIDGDYILLIGGNNPRKNAISVIAQIEAIKKLGYKLVILNSENAVFNSFDKTKHSSIIHLDYTTQEHYYSLIKYAKALVYPSLYEGFGIPILESLCLQTPVICSDLLVFRESFENLPIYFNTSDPSDFFSALERLYTSTISDLAVEKLKQKYSFDESVSLILKTLQEI